MIKIQNDLLNPLMQKRNLSISVNKDNFLSIIDLKNKLDQFGNIDDNIRILDDRYKNSSMLIEQDKINGRCIDLEMIWNKDNKRIFIGFQIKCFRAAAKGGNTSKITKFWIKNYYLDILKNSKNLLGIEIDEWHYIMILYYNPKDLVINKNGGKDCGICQYLINKCRIQGIKYILYDLFECIFYNQDLTQINSQYTL